MTALHEQLDAMARAQDRANRSGKPMAFGYWSTGRGEYVVRPAEDAEDDGDFIILGLCEPETDA